MSTVKDEVIQMIRSLPDDCTLDDVAYYLEVRRKVERGIKDIEEGRVVTQEEAERRVAEWVKSYGPNPR